MRFVCMLVRHFNIKKAAAWIGSYRYREGRKIIFDSCTKIRIDVDIVNEEVITIAIDAAENNRGVAIA